ncbi:MAG: hypothetical protein AAB853_04940 [Patescibacteria group bacterium]
MKNSPSNEYPQESDSSTGITKLSAELFQAAPESLSGDVRSFLDKTLSLYDQSVPEASAWLRSPITALNGAVPVDELRKGNAQSLHRFWDELTRVHGY